MEGFSVNDPDYYEEGIQWFSVNDPNYYEEGTEWFSVKDPDYYREMDWGIVSQWSWLL